MSLPTGCCSNKALMVLTIAVTGWFSAKARTGPGMEAVDTTPDGTPPSVVHGAAHYIGHLQPAEWAPRKERRELGTVTLPPDVKVEVQQCVYG